MEDLDNLEKADNQSFVLPKVFTIAQVNEYYQPMLNLAGSGNNLILDASAVNHIDAAGIQLLFVIQRALKENGNKLLWVAVSTTVKKSVALLGLADVLALND